MSVDRDGARITRVYFGSRCTRTSFSQTSLRSTITSAISTATHRFNHGDRFRVTNAFKMLATSSILLRSQLVRLSTAASLAVARRLPVRRFSSIPNTLSSRLPACRALGGAGSTPLSQQVRGMKVRSSVKKLCDGCMVRLPPQGGSSRSILLSALLTSLPSCSAQ